MKGGVKAAHKYLDSLLVFGVKLGLQNMEAMCSLLGNPQNELRFIHVAGTNGKGSTCSMLAAALKNCGLKTGFYSSPFLYRFTERWRINGIEVSEADVAQAILKISSLEEELSSITGVRPTYFEVLTAAALLVFKNAGVEIVVWETGLGGRLDATNVVTPLLSVITNIELDHTQYLGETILDIAYEKGGIIKAGIPFICGDIKADVMGYYLKLSKERGAPCVLSGDFSVLGAALEESESSLRRRITYKSFKKEISFYVRDIGRYQVANAGVAIAALEALEESIGLDFDKAVKGLSQFKWPGRLEVRSNGLILDGAHNPVGAKACVESLEEIAPQEKFYFICGILKDKNWREVIDVFLEKAESFYFVSLENERASECEDLRSYALSVGAKVLGQGTVEEALGQIKRPERSIAVGSLYLIGEILSSLNHGEPIKIDSLA